MPGPQSSDVDSTIHQLADNPTVIGYVVISSEGIPVKYHEKMKYEMAVKYACLMSEFFLKARKTLKDLHSGPDSDLSHFRMRTQEGSELIGMAYSDYFLLVIQNCTGKPWKYQDDPDTEISNPQ